MQQPTRGTSARIPFLPLALVTTGLFLIAYWPAIKILVSKWLHSEEYNHALFTVPIIGYMIWQKKDTLAADHGAPHLLCLPLLIFSSLIYLLTLQMQIPTAIALAMVLTLFSCLLYLYGFVSFRKLATPLILLLVIIPIPNQVYSTITLPLQLKVTQLSSLILQVLQIPTMREGNIIHIPTKTFQVVEACSGLRSMITLLTLSLIMGYFMLHSFLARLILLVMSVPVAFIVNVVRVVLMVTGYHFFRIDLLQGMRHNLLGLAVFSLALVILFAVEKTLERWER